MNIRIPNGGFFAAVCNNENFIKVSHRLEQSGALQVAFNENSTILAAWPEFPGQNLWIGEKVAVAYDLDLTNQEAMHIELGEKPNDSCTPGELLWRLYKTKGTEFINKLRGAFAFALWDGEDQNLLVATDHYGVRPTVFSEIGRDFVAASRIRHVLMHPGVGRSIDPDAIYQYLFFSVIPTPHTVYKDIRKLAPGCFLKRKGHHTKETVYYDIRYRPDLTAGEQHWLKAIPEELRKAVARQIPLSSPEITGCFLSGGTDSSSVAGYYNELSGQPAKTFSIGFDHPEYNEMRYADIAARHFGTIQQNYYVTPEDVLALLERLPEIFDEPFGNSSVIPAYYCARLAKENGVDVLLAGDGGDEIFGGNERYVKNLVFSKYHRIPALVRNWMMEPIIKALPSVGLILKMQRYIRRANIPNPDRFFSYNFLYENTADTLFKPEFMQTLTPDSFLKLARAHYAAAAPADETDRLLYLDMKFTITDNDIRKVTQMAETAGILVRYPLLDQDLVEFTTTLPPSLKVKPGKNRYIFKRAMAGFLPNEIISKEKHGFGLPVGPWFHNHGELNTLLQDTLFSSEARIVRWVSPKALQQMWIEFNGKDISYHGANFWILLILELWMRHHEI